MASVSRTAQFAKVSKVLKKHYKPVLPDVQRPVLEHLLFSCCLENAHYQAAEEAFAAVGTEISWKGTGVDRVGIDIKTGRTVVDVSPEFYRPAEVETLMGDASKAKEVLGWNPQTKFSGLVKMMVEADLNRKGDRAGSAVSRTQEEELAEVRTMA